MSLHCHDHEKYALNLSMFKCDKILATVASEIANNAIDKVWMFRV